MAASIETEELDVAHVRQPRQRMPISSGYGRESPDKVLCGEPANYLGILEDVDLVIIADEVVLEDGRKCEERQEKENRR